MIEHHQLVKGVLLQQQQLKTIVGNYYEEINITLCIFTQWHYHIVSQTTKQRE